MRTIFHRSAWYFGASVAGAGIALVILPLATRRIGPKEYGAVAIAVSVAALVTSCASAAIGYAFSEHLLKLKAQDRKQLIASALISVAGVGLCAAALLLPVALLVLPHFTSGARELKIGIQICILAAVIGTPWLVCSEVLILEGRAILYVIGTIGQGMVNGGTVLIFLYLKPLPEYALFLGNISGQLILLLASLYALHDCFCIPATGRWFREMWRMSFAVGRASLADSGRTLFERSYLGAWASVTEVGLFAHSQLYRNWAMVALNSVSRAVWPVNLQEAIEDPPTFKVTNASWATVQAGIAFLCIGFALLGRELIARLTSGKFVDSTPYAVILLCGLLVQTAGKPQTALLIARGQGHRSANATSVATLAGVGFTALLVPFYGALGAAYAIVMQFALMRLLIVTACRRIGPLPFRDGWIVVGLGGVVLARAWVVLFAPGMLPKIVIVGIVGALSAFFVRRSALVFFKHVGSPHPIPHSSADGAPAFP